jgi:hypothetical protein
MKKKIAIILFNKQLHDNLYILLMPRLLLNSKSFNISKVSHGIKYVFLNNKSLILKTTNLFYLFFFKKIELTTFLISNLKTFFGFKFKNLYFTSLTIKRFNYIKKFCFSQFLITLKKFYFYFFHFIFALKKNIKNLK